MPAALGKEGSKTGDCCNLDRSTDAKVAELADAPDLGSGSREAMGVRLPPFAFSLDRTNVDRPI